jgi:hypothetical protein
MASGTPSAARTLPAESHTAQPWAVGERQLLVPLATLQIFTRQGLSGMRDFAADSADMVSVVDTDGVGEADGAGADGVLAGDGAWAGGDGARSGPGRRTGITRGGAITITVPHIYIPIHSLIAARS